MTSRTVVGFEGFHTMMRKDVKAKLVAFAKKRTSFTGAWDYSNAIDELLWSYQVFWNVNTRLDELELELKELKADKMEKEVNKMEVKDKKEEKNKNPLGLLGKRHLKEEVEEEKDGKD